MTDQPHSTERDAQHPDDLGPPEPAMTFHVFPADAAAKERDHASWLARILRAKEEVGR